MFKENKTLHRSLLALLAVGLVVCLVMFGVSALDSAKLDAAAAASNAGAQSNGEAMENFINQSGIMMLIHSADWRSLLMILISFVLLYLAIGKGFEPLLLLPIAFGMLLTNLPGAGMYHPEIFINESGHIN